MIRRPPRSTLFPLHDALPISLQSAVTGLKVAQHALDATSRNIANVTTDGYTRKTLPVESVFAAGEDRKSTRLNSSHANISYAVFCLKKKNIDLLPHTCRLQIP